MNMEWISWLAALLVVTSVVVKIVTANVIARLHTELGRLQAELRKQQGVVESLVEHRASLEDNLEFFERRKEEDHELGERLQIDLEACEASNRKHLSELGYDADEIEAEALKDAELAAHEDGAGSSAVSAGGVVAVLPATVGDSDKLFLPDAVITELLSHGVRIMDRSTINQRLAENGADLRHILDEEQYHRLHTEAEIDAVAIINSRLMGSGIGSATCRVIHFPSGEILSSVSYEQPGRDERADDFESITGTARKLANLIRGIVEKDTTS